MSPFPDPVGRKKAAELWSRLLDTSQSEPPSSLMALSKVLQDLAEEFDKRVRSGWASDLYSLAWCNYFVAAFGRVLRDLPPCKDLDSIGELCEAIARLEITAPSDASATTTTIDVKPTDSSSSDDITFKVDNQGGYKARIVKEGTATTLEFLLNGPATVTVHVHRGTLNQLIGEGSSRSAYVPSVGIAASVAGSTVTGTATGSACATEEKEEEERIYEYGEPNEDADFGLWS
ncbi:hypothetical protein GE21DRAFT_8472 [Neurospora crassa]|uniref:Uncharacterized protein n=2 Tax=Neurospora crassa TaxID=5141 RepID=Q1K5U0_NEUCR|nr:hypothetical protein NCU07208 [Neurospora crassa OR74A]EAA28197.1 hypothetical protein NCU07208 [Neurospora crassa OR74A]KHE85760.1 hypothetical protein GE21DRAFT_8472 [Neurospora crassa]CAD71074.1 related to acidic ribosomal protein p2 [Neurospora crassa]|eukprot:XP_957433.1 hypothetical protein NCU07208 [Neurospora crassa OR74A]